MNCSWPFAELGSLTEEERSITYGVVKPGEEVEGGVTFVRGGDITQGRIAIGELRTIAPQLSQVYRRTVLRGGELLISLVGNPGEVAVAPSSLEGANIARQVGLIALRPEFDARFAMYFLMSPLGRAELFSRTGGAVQQVINLADLKTLKLPVPPRNEQQRIVSILSAYDEAINNNRRRMGLLEKAARLLYQEWFVRLRFPGHEHTPIANGIPAGWDRVSFEDALVLQRGFDLPESQWEEGDFPICGSTGIIGRHHEAKAKGPGVFTGRSGSLGVVNHVDEDYWPHNTALWVREFKKVTPLFALFLMREMNLTQYNGGASVPTLDRKAVHRVPVLIPARRFITLFDEQLTPMFAQLRNLRLQNQQLRAARDLLLPRLMTGEVTV
jgi:type I restriction enzyme S subunit